MSNNFQWQIWYHTSTVRTLIQQHCCYPTVQHQVIHLLWTTLTSAQDTHIKSTGNRPQGHMPFLLLNQQCQSTEGIVSLPQSTRTDSDVCCNSTWQVISHRFVPLWCTANSHSCSDCFMHVHQSCLPLTSLQNSQIDNVTNLSLLAAVYDILLNYWHR